MKKTFAPIIIILALAALGIVAWKVFPMAHLDAPQIVTLSDTAVPKKYESDKFGISFSYPGNYFLDERDINDARSARHSIVLMEDNETTRLIREGKLDGAEGPPSITIDIFQSNLGNQTPLAWISGDARSNFKFSDGTYEDASIAGVPAIHYFWDGLYRGESIVFTHNGNMMMLSVTSLAPADRINADFAAIVRSCALIK